VQKSISPVGLRVLELSSKKRLLGASRKKFESVREWTDADLDAVFEEARERNVWFRSVGFEFASEKDGRVLSTGTRAGISKYGYFYCNGDFDVFERTLVQDLLVFSSNRLKFFTGRDRATTVRHSPHPLQITYSVPIFRESDQGKRLVESMKKFKHGTCSVLHANPYIHLSVVDNKDFSSADLWVLAQDHILLVPQLRASAAALKRIVNHIFENFKEGQLSDYKEQQA
jgi:hypothetical protein